MGMPAYAGHVNGDPAVRAIQSITEPAIETIEERMGIWWGHMQQNERGALCVLGGVPLSIAYEDQFHVLDEKEQKAILNALKSAGVLCDLVIHASHFPRHLS